MCVGYSGVSAEFRPSEAAKIQQIPRETRTEPLQNPTGTRQNSFCPVGGWLNLDLCSLLPYHAKSFYKFIGLGAIGAIGRQLLPCQT